MKKFFVLAAVAAMFTLSGCGCRNTETDTECVEITEVEPVDSTIVDTLDIETVVDTLAE